METHKVCRKANGIKLRKYSNKSPTRRNSFPVYYPDVYLQLYMFRSFSRPSSGAQWLQWQPLVLLSYRVDSRAVFVVGPVITETCRAVNKRQDNKLKNCCIKLVIYLNCTMMHGLTNLKFKNCENIVTSLEAICLPDCEYTNNNQMQQWLNKIEEQLSDNILDLEIWLAVHRSIIL
jgi:hypothetical protein